MDDGGEGINFTSRKLSPAPPSVQKAGAVMPSPVIVSPTALAGRPLPPRRWIVRDWIPCGVVTALYGDGGLGKSLMAQQLQTATALGSPWLALPVAKVVSLAVFCEDDHDELWRRQAAINEAYRVDFDALGDVHWMPRLGEENLLMTFAGNGAGQLTPFHAQVLAEARRLKARLVIIDTAADVFAGNENDRGHVRQFISRALGSIARAIDGAVLLCAHPSRSGLTSGEGDGGSTGWSNTVRSRLYLSARALEPGEAPDTNARILERRKANYAARNDVLALRWRNGVIEPEAPLSPGATPFGKLDAKEVFLNLLRECDEQNRFVSENSRASNYAPRMFERMPRDKRLDFRKADFAHAMEALFAARRLENLDYGRPSDARRRIVPAAGSPTQ